MLSVLPFGMRSTILAAGFIEHQFYAGLKRCWTVEGQNFAQLQSQ